MKDSRFQNINLSTIDRSSKKLLAKLNPIGFSVEGTNSDKRGSKTSKKSEPLQEEKDKIFRLKIKKAWDLALSPAKSIPMNAFMMYMSGNSIQIFSIMITLMLFWNSVNAISSSALAFEQFQNTPGIGSRSGFAGFKRLQESQLLLPLCAYILIQLGNTALGVWKCSSMGLLPTATSDWLAFMEPSMYRDLVHHAL